MLDYFSDFYVLGQIPNHSEHSEDEIPGGRPKGKHLKDLIGKGNGIG